MRSTPGKIIITNEDYDRLSPYMKGLMPVNGFDKNNTALLREELMKATLVKKDELPPGVVRLNSRVIIKDEIKNKLIELTLVVPEKADIKARRISVFAPVGTALIGYSEGENVKWEVPAGKKSFIIMKVYNQSE
jgi:regulator of nucleoside diphosphate kinase